MYIEASAPPDCRSARNNLYSGIPHVSSGLHLYLLPVQYFPLLPVQCFPLLPGQCFPLLPVRISDSDLLVRIGDPELPFAAAIPIPVSGPSFRSPFPVPISGPRSVSRFGFRSISRSVSRFGFRFVSHIGFCSTILDSRPTPVTVPVPDSVSASPSLRQCLPLLLALLPRSVALYRRQRLIKDSHSARPRRVRSCGSRPRPVTGSFDGPYLGHNK